MTSHYKPSIKDLESHGGIHRLEKNGLNREQISKAIYNLTDGASVQKQREIVERLYDRRELC